MLILKYKHAFTNTKYRAESTETLSIMCYVIKTVRKVFRHAQVQRTSNSVLTSSNTKIPLQVINILTHY